MSRHLTKYNSIEIKVTVSTGIALFDPSNPVTHLELIQHADKALYQAKNNGRNQVRIYQV